MDASAGPEPSYRAHQMVCMTHAASLHPRLLLAPLLLELLLDLLHREGVQLRRQRGRDGEVARLGAAQLVQVPAGPACKCVHATRQGDCVAGKRGCRPALRQGTRTQPHLSTARAASSGVWQVWVMSFCLPRLVRPYQALPPGGTSLRRWTCLKPCAASFALVAPLPPPRWASPAGCACLPRPLHGQRPREGRKQACFLNADDDAWVRAAPHTPLRTARSIPGAPVERWHTVLLLPVLLLLVLLRLLVLVALVAAAALVALVV